MQAAARSWVARRSAQFTDQSVITYWTILGRHQTVALTAHRLHGLQLLSAEVEVGLVEGSLLHLAAGGDGGGAVVQGGEGFLGRV